MKIRGVNYSMKDSGCRFQPFPTKQNVIVINYSPIPQKNDEHDSPILGILSQVWSLASRFTVDTIIDKIQSFIPGQPWKRFGSLADTAIGIARKVEHVDMFQDHQPKWKFTYEVGQSSNESLQPPIRRLGTGKVQPAGLTYCSLTHDHLTTQRLETQGCTGLAVHVFMQPAKKKMFVYNEQQ